MPSQRRLIVDLLEEIDSEFGELDPDSDLTWGADHGDPCDDHETDRDHTEADEYE